jgi:hypothetical protein
MNRRARARPAPGESDPSRATHPLDWAMTTPRREGHQSTRRYRPSPDPRAPVPDWGCRRGLESALSRRAGQGTDPHGAAAIPSSPRPLRGASRAADRARTAPRSPDRRFRSRADRRRRRALARAPARAPPRRRRAAWPSPRHRDRTQRRARPSAPDARPAISTPSSRS